MKKILTLTGALLILIANSTLAQFSKTLLDASLNGKITESNIHWYKYDRETKTIIKVREMHDRFDDAGRQLQENTLEVLNGRRVENSYKWNTEGTPKEMVNEVFFEGDVNSYSVQFSHVRKSGNWVTYEMTKTDTPLVYQYISSSPEFPKMIRVLNSKGESIRIDYFQFSPSTNLRSNTKITHLEANKAVRVEDITYDENGERKIFAVREGLKETLLRDDHGSVIKSVMEVGGKEYTSSESIYEYDGLENWTKAYRKRFDEAGNVIEELYGFRTTLKRRETPKGSLKPDYEFIKKTNLINK
ncbi:hypothetical protein ACV07N_12295 [Roseivirga echinicomitans]